MNIVLGNRRYRFQVKPSAINSQATLSKEIYMLRALLPYLLAAGGGGGVGMTNCDDFFTLCGRENEKLC